MKYFLLFLILIIILPPIVAQEQKASELLGITTTRKADSIKGKTGVVPLPFAHSRIKVPDGFVLLNLEDSRRLLIDLWKKPQEKFYDVVGILVKSDDKVLENIETAYVLSYRKEGYYDDKNTENLSIHEGLLKIMKHNLEAEEKNKPDSLKIKLLDWAAYPDYDNNNKILFWAEYLEEGVGRRFINCKARVLGSKGYVAINGIGAIKDKDKLISGMPIISRSITFDNGNAYYDFNPASDQIAVNTVGALIKEMSGTEANLFKPNAFMDAASYGWDFIVFFGVKKVAAFLSISIGCLFLLLLIALLDLYLHPTGNGKKESRTVLIALYTRNAVARLRVFAMIYSILMFGSFALLVGMAYATVYYVAALFNGWGEILFNWGPIGVLGIIIILNAFGVIWMVTITSVRIFLHQTKKMFSENNSQKRIAVSDLEAPDLYQFVKGVTESIGVSMPEHIYIETRVFANADYSSIFKAIRNKPRYDLTIGLPLLFLLSVQELKALTGQEFGKFAQKSLRKVTACLYIHSKIKEAFVSENNDLLNRNDYDRALCRKWRELIDGFKRFLTRCLNKLFIFATSPHNDMTKIMEFMADETGAKIAGKEFSISLFHKTDILQSCVSKFIEITEAILRQKKKAPTNLIECLQVSLPRLQSFIGSDVTFSDILYDVPNIYPDSRIETISSHDIHSSISNRIKELRKSRHSEEKSDLTPALSLLSDSMFKAIQTALADNEYPEGVEIIPNEEFITVINSRIINNTSLFFRLLLNRHLFIKKDDLRIAPLDINEDFINHAVKISKEYYVALKDLDTINDFYADKPHADSLRYCGKIWYSNCNGLKDIHMDYIRALEDELKIIDCKIYSAALACNNNSQEVADIYEDIIYAQKIREQFKDLFGRRIYPIRIDYIFRPQLDKTEAISLKSDIIRLYNDMKDFIINNVETSKFYYQPLDKGKIKAFCDSNITSINEFSDSRSAIGNLLGFYDTIIKEHDGLMYHCKYRISKILETSGKLHFCTGILSEWPHEQDSCFEAIVHFIHRMESDEIEGRVPNWAEDSLII